MAIELLNIDCMEYMRGLPDKAFDLAIVDPPYGIERFKDVKQSGNRVEAHFSSGAWNNNEVGDEYFSELFRISIEQIVWGFNHLCDRLPKTQGFVYWHKHQNGNFSEGELAWCSIGNGKFYDRPYQKDIGNKIHPCQKPVQLYEWLLQNYAKQGDKILDTHLGSGSSAIAAHYGGFDFVGCELDTDYFNAAKQRFERETAQLAMFGA
jgi:site-specific DNA-methyltransferase (adenine-specific)